MANNREISQFGNYLTIDENVNKNVGIATTVRISGGGGLYVGGIEVIDPTGTWKGPGSGLIGAQGAQGSAGAQGAQGSAGSQGSSGAQGSAGAQGAQGTSGTLGSTGAQGAQGTTGPTGAQGATGTDGPPGPTGSQGSSGSSVTGPPGPTGAQGAPGSSGGTGPTGAQGAQGTAGAQGATGSASAVIPSGSVFLLYQANAPTGWTKVTTQNNKALRVVSGTGGGIGGSTAFTSVFASRTPSGSVTMNNAAFTLTTNEIPSHSHGITDPGHVHSGAAQWPGSGPEQDQSGGPENRTTFNINTGSSTTGISINSTGGGGSHTHANTASFTGTAMDFDVQFIDIILCSKD